ncbi:MAG TPA: GAP family protein, partial [Microbacterium sp.]|nr:GAP family protein [Microbacterium sp.]
QQAPARPGRIVRWRARLLDPKTSRSLVMGVAIAAGAVEVATMLPYIVAMTMLADAGVDVGVRILALVGYCLLMILPALVLLVLRIAAAPLVARPLERFAAWMERTGAENTAWIIGIIGFLIARTAANELGLFEALSNLGGN